MKCDFCKEEISDTQYKTRKKKRYHNGCYEKLVGQTEVKNQQKAKSLKNNDKESLEQYICLLYEIDEISYKIEKQIEDFVSQRGYTYSGIQKTLYYFYELENNLVGEFTSTIGIVLHYYDKAKVFFETAHSANMFNENFVREDKTVHIKIKPKSRNIPCVIDIESL